MPIPRLPNFELVPQMLASSVSIAIVIYVITLSSGILFAKKHGYRTIPAQVYHRSIVVHHWLFRSCVHCVSSNWWRRRWAVYRRAVVYRERRSIHKSVSKHRYIWTFRKEIIPQRCWLFSYQTYSRLVYCSRWSYGWDRWWNTYQKYTCCQSYFLWILYILNNLVHIGIDYRRCAKIVAHADARVAKALANIENWFCKDVQNYTGSNFGNMQI